MRRVFLRPPDGAAAAAVALRMPSRGSASGATPSPEAINNSPGPSTVLTIHQRGVRLATQRMVRHRLAVTSCPRIAELSLGAAVSSTHGTRYPEQKSPESSSSPTPTPSPSGPPPAEEELELHDKFLCRHRILAATEAGRRARLQALRQKRYSCATAPWVSDDARRHPSLPPAEARTQAYEPFIQLLHLTVERDTVDPSRLLYHPEAPSPAHVLLRVMEHRVPSAALVSGALEACAAGYRGGEAVTARNSDVPVALRRVALLLRRHCPTLYGDAALQPLLLRALVAEGLFVEAIALLSEMPLEHVTPDAWAALVDAAAHNRLPHSQVLWTLLQSHGLLEGKTPASTSDDEPATAASFAVQGSAVQRVPLSSARLLLRNSAEEEQVVAEGTRDATSGPEMEASMVAVDPATSLKHSVLLSAGAWRYAAEHRPAALAAALHAVPSLRSALQASAAQRIEAALAVCLRSRGVAYGLNTATATQLLLRAGTGFSGLAPPLLARHILQRYHRSCTLLQAEVRRLAQQTRGQLEAIQTSMLPLEARGSSSSSRSILTDPSSSGPPLDAVAAPHPTPYFALFRILREARSIVPQETQLALKAETDTEVPTPAPTASAVVGVAHWSIAWCRFQELNHDNPLWMTPAYHQLHPAAAPTPEEVEEAARDVLAVLSRGADPWMCLNVARRFAARHILDGLEAALWLLHRLDPTHHPEEAREVSRKVFQWLLTDVGVHLQPQLHHHLIPATRVLIRLHLQEELRGLYNVVLDHAHAFSPAHREAFMGVMADLVCPQCSALLPPPAGCRSPSEQVYLERRCVHCMAVVPAKDPSAAPSFALTAEHIARIRAKRRAEAEAARQRQYERAQQMEGGGPPSWAKGRRPDAAETLRRRLQRGSETSDQDAMIPGVPVAYGEALQLYTPPSASAGETAEPLGSSSSTLTAADVQAARAEAQRRLAVHRAARARALGLSQPLGGAEEWRGREAGRAANIMIPGDTAGVTTLSDPAAPLTDEDPTAIAAGPWVCVWCREQHTAWASRVRCDTCGALTGPQAPWRRFAYDESGRDAMAELRARMAHAADRLRDAVTAAYLLMLYRRTFLLRAVPHDYVLVQGLIEVLALQQERVLAAYVFTRFVPPRDRLYDDRRAVRLLAELFNPPDDDDQKKVEGGGGAQGVAQHAADVEKTTTAGRLAALHALDDAAVQDDETLFPLLFGPHTCRLCFGRHDHSLCPIITRNFAPHEAGDGKGDVPQQAPLRASASERLRAAVAHLQRCTSAAEKAMQTAEQQQQQQQPVCTAAAAEAVATAYTTFLGSPFRLQLARHFPALINTLSILLSRLGQCRRAALVLCHIPQEARENAAYRPLLRYYQVDETAALRLLASRPASASPPPTSSPARRQAADSAAARHPNFMQVTLTCCMCLEEHHASHQCPRLQDWLDDVLRLRLDVLARRCSGRGGSRTLQAQVAGWTAAGPERLQSFYRFLMQELTTRGGAALRRGAGSPANYADPTDPLVYAINQTIVALLRPEEEGGAARDGEGLEAVASAKCLYAHTPSQLLYQETVLTMLCRGAGYEPATAAQLLEGSKTVSPTAAAAAVPLSHHCMMCFQPLTSARDTAGAAPHGFMECPKHGGAQATLAQRVALLCQRVGGIVISPPCGVVSAAAGVQLLYVEGRLKTGWLRQEPAVAALLARLAERCFAARELAAGVRLLRHLPLEMVEPESAFAPLWRAAGLTASEVEERVLSLLSLCDGAGLRPSLAAPPPRRSYPAAFLSQRQQVVYDGLCRHCFAADHALPHCPVLQEEINFGRDYVAAYRMSMIAEDLDTAWQNDYLLRLTDFARSHRLFMPYHIRGVANALNAVVAMWCFRGEAGIAAQHLIAIPPAYRRRQSFRHVLHALHVPSAEITQVLNALHFSSAATGAAAASSAVTYHHLLSPRQPFRDEARRVAIDPFPAAQRAFSEAEERREAIAAAVAETATPGRRGPARASALVPQQTGGIAQLREDFDPILTRLEEALGMKLGSRHAFFSSAVDILAAETEATQADKTDTHAQPVATCLSSALEQERSNSDEPRTPRSSSTDDACEAAAQGTETSTPASATLPPPTPPVSAPMPRHSSTGRSADGREKNKRQESASPPRHRRSTTSHEGPSLSLPHAEPPTAGRGSFRSAELQYPNPNPNSNHRHNGARAGRGGGLGLRIRPRGQGEQRHDLRDRSSRAEASPSSGSNSNTTPRNRRDGGGGGRGRY